MVKCEKTLVQAAEYFLKGNRVEIRYPTLGAELVKKNKVILVNGERIFKKNLGSFIFLYCESHSPFKKKWGELKKDLAEQVLSQNRKA
jgi:hypothetical protein